MDNPLWEISYHRADNLLLELYAAGCRSSLDRQQAGYGRFQEVTVRYPHNDGSVTPIKMNHTNANRSTSLAEDAIISSRGRL